MEKTKRSLALVMLVIFLLSNATFVVFASEESVAYENITVIDSQDPTQTVNLTESYYTISDNDETNYTFIRFDVGDVDKELVVKATFSIYMYTNKGSRYFSVSRVTDEWNPQTGEYTVDTDTTISDIYCGWLWNERKVDITNLIKACEDDTLIICVQPTGTFSSTSDGRILISASDANKPTLELTIDEAPTISGEHISGTPVEGFDLRADYIFSSDLHNEKDSVIDWLCADTTDGDNETVVLADGGKDFDVESEYIGKYIRAKITPYSDGGFYVKGGKEHSNIYYTDYIGPVKAAAYLDELTIAISEECADTTELYNYLEANENIFELGVTDLNSYSKKDQVLSNLLEDPPVNFADLVIKYANEFATIKIEEALANDIEELLAETHLDLISYEDLSDKDFVLTSLESETFLNYQDLENAFSKFITGAQIKAGTNAEKIAVILGNGAQHFKADIANCSYGEILYASQYIIAAEKTAVTDFDKLDSLVNEAIEYGKENYIGGYITSKKTFIDEVCIKTDYAASTSGINSIVAPAGSYSLFGNTNIGNYTQQLFLKLDISDLMDYHIHSASINLYGTVGGGADKIVEIVSASEFESSNDFIERYPTGAELTRGETLAQVKYSFGTTKWNKAVITNFILEKVEKGEDYVYLLIDYTGNSMGSDLSKGATIHSNIAAGDKAPYVEIIYETPPVAKNINVRGVKAVGSTLTAEYDYFGCYEEEGSVFNWYYADKNEENYENITAIVKENSSTLELKPEYANKCIIIDIKPGSKEGFYREGEFTPSGFTLPILDAQSAVELTGELNSVADISTVLNDADKSQYLDINTTDDMQMLETDGQTKVLSILTNTTFSDLNHFKSYYPRMINVQAINEAEYEELDSLIKNTDTGTSTQRYTAFEDNTSILNAVYNRGFESVESYQTAYNEACAVYEFNTVDHSNVQELILAYDFMFSQDVASYNDDKLELVGNFFMTEIQNKKGSFSTIQTALTSAVNSAGCYTPGVDTGTDEGGNGGNGGKDKIVSVPSSSGSNLVPAIPTKVFNDLTPVASWAETSILKLNEKGVLSGDGKGNFRPNDNITREEFIKVAVVAFDIEAEGENNFSDVDEDAWYREYVNTAVNAGIINGVGDNLFGTGTQISREDMCTILYRIMLQKGVVSQDEKKLSFTDETEIATYAKNAVAALSEKGIINGMGDNLFVPKGNATRAMVAVMIDRAINLEN